MSNNSSIEWTDATWNPTTGCSKISPGCEHCYAETFSLRLKWTAKPWTSINAIENVKLHPERLTVPYSWKKPVRVFVNSMSDLFHEAVPDSFIFSVLDVIADTPQHTYQILTKRPARMNVTINSWLNEKHLNHCSLPVNIWLGTSAEDQRRADERIPDLLMTPAHVRFVSCEPLLGPIDLSAFMGGLDWIIDGGESGSGRRAADIEWFRLIKYQCVNANVAYFHKQGNAFRPGQDRVLDGEVWEEYPLRYANQEKRI